MNEIIEDRLWLAEGLADWDYRVLWSAYPCSTAPDVRIAETEGHIDAITITVGPIVSPDGDCDSMEARHAVDLRTRSPVTDETIVTLRQSP